MKNKTKKQKQVFEYKAINTYDTHILPEIDYDMYITYACIHLHCQRTYNILANEKETPKGCLDMLNKDFYTYEQPDIVDLKRTNSLEPMLRAYYMSYLKSVGLSNVCLIGPIFSIVDSLLEIGVQPDFLYIKDIELPNDKEAGYLKQLTVPYTVSSLNNLHDKLPKQPKYDNVIIKIKELNNVYYLPLFAITKFPSFLLQTIRGLFELRQGGNMYLFWDLGIVHPAMKWLMMVLSNLFETMSIIRDPLGSSHNIMMFMIECRGFKRDLTPKQRSAFIDILSNQSLSGYNYTLCEFMDYYSSQVRTSSQVKSTDPNLYPLLKSKTKKKGRKELMVLDTINIDMGMEHNATSHAIIYQLRNIYMNHINDIHYNIKKYVKRVGHKISVDPVYIEKVTYMRLSTIIAYMEQNGIPYNKSYNVYLKKYNADLLDKLYSYTTAVQYKLLKYHYKSSLTIGKVDTYSIPALEDINKLSSMAHVVKKSLLSSVTKMPTIIRQITDDFARGVAQYINEGWPWLERPVTNAFCKFWELLSLHPWLMPGKKPNIFYVAESPSQWVYASSMYGKKSVWIATSLNPDHPENFEKGGFQDEYGFIRRNKKNWIWGADNTGDITHVANLRWYREYIRERSIPVDLITSDAGINSDILSMQKLELAQALMVLGCASPGTHCCIKHFLPFINEIPETTHANGFFMNLIYLYGIAFKEVQLVKPLTSSQNSGEFYILGKHFTGFPEEHYEALLSVLDNFEANTCFIREADLPESFKQQIIKFIRDLTNRQIEIDENTNLLLTCMIKKDPVIEKETQCTKVLKIETIKKIQAERFKAWVTEHRFDP